MKRISGFTLVELLTVISIMAILAGVIYFNASQGSAQSRDVERRGELRTLQSALELYKLDNGRYPAGCRAPGQWSGQSGTVYACASGNQYIVGLAPDYIPALPTDPRRNGNESGYVYTTNTDGSVYKLMARLSVETPTEQDLLRHPTEHINHPFKSCDVTFTNTGFCDQTHPSGNKPNHCDSGDSRFYTTYAVWGGFATSSPVAADIERYTEDIVCDIP